MRRVRAVTDDANMTKQTNELIALGRDREAVASALGGPVDGVQRLEGVMTLLKQVAGNISEEDLGRPTPCAKFDVEGVLEHMLGGAHAFAPGFRGDGSAPNPPTEGSILDRWDSSMDTLMDAVHTEGAKTNILATPFGEVTGDFMASYASFDGLCHLYDLASSTGQSVTPPDALVAEIDAFARGFLQPEMRDGDTFAQATDPPADATPLERLVAFSGRTVVR